MYHEVSSVQHIARWWREMLDRGRCEGINPWYMRKIYLLINCTYSTGSDFVTLTKNWRIYWIYKVHYVILVYPISYSEEKKFKFSVIVVFSITAAVASVFSRSTC
jgi:hypothetical protein